MKRTYPTLLLLLCFLYSSFCTAQQSEQILLYQISADDARELYKDGELEDRHFHDLHAQYDRMQIIDPPVGHYLQVEAWAEKIQIQLRSIHSFQTDIISNDRDLILQLADSTGQLITNAKVTLNGRSIPFESSINSYFKKKSHKKGWLEVNHNGEVAFYQLEDEKYQSLFRQFLISTTTGKIISSPVRLSKRVIWRLKYLFRGDNNKRSRQKIKWGYVALNKPLYRPGDTLQMKAYVINKRKKPWKDSLEFSLVDNGQKVIMEQVLAPEQAGSFNINIVLGDSLQVDRYYDLQLKEVGKASRAIRHSFQIKDYELDQFSFELKPEKKIFTTEDNPTLLLSALGANGLPTTGGQVNIVLQITGIDAIHEKELWIADTLWQYQGELPAEKEVSIIIPSNFLPKADVNITAKVKYQAPDGQLVEKNCRFKINKKTERLSLQLQDGYLAGHYYISDRTDTVEATLTTTTSTGVVKEQIELPFRIPLNPFATDYTVFYKALTTSFYPNRRNSSEDSHPTLSGSNQLDSVEFTVDNPYRLPFTYFIFQEKRLFEKGQSKEVLFRWQHSNNTDKHFEVKVIYILGGRFLEEVLSLPFYKKQLQIAIYQPIKAVPNQQTSVQIEVTQSNGKPAAGVNLSTGAYRSQFELHENLRLPSVSYKAGKKPFIYNNYKLSSTNNKRFLLPLSPHWFNLLQLEGQRFYELRLLEQGVSMYYDTINGSDFHQQIAQFAPFIFKKGEEQAIWFAYLDDQLIYYGEQYKHHPYSFVGKAGVHKLSLRTAEREYTIEGLLLKKGQKLELAIDADKYPAYQGDLKIKHRTMPDYLQYNELTLVRNNMMEIKRLPKGKDCYLWVDSTNIFTIRKDYAHSTFIGPIAKGDTLHFVQKDGFTAQVPFDPGFAHEIKENRDRLFKSTSFDFTANKKIRASRSSPYHLPHELIFDPAQIEYKSDPLAKFQLENFDTKESNIQYGHYRIVYADSLQDLLAIVIRHAEGQGQLFKHYFRHFGKLPLGAYELFLIKQSGEYTKQAFNIRPDTTLCQSLDHLTFTSDSSDYYLKQFFLSDTLNPPDSLLQYISSLKGGEALTKNKPYLISGQVTELGTGEPVIFASVAIFQNGRFIAGTSTDFDGFYRAAVPAGMIDVEVSYVGFQNQRIVRIIVNRDIRLDITMDEGDITLDEVMVVSYSIPRNTAPPRKSYAKLDMNHPNTGNLDSLLRLDRYSGLRSDFRDYAYFGPTLITDQDGKAYLSPNLPGTLSNWESFALGMDKKGRAGAAFSAFQTYKPLTAELFLPRFMLVGDQAMAKGQLSNYSEDEVQLTTQFLVEDRLVQSNNLSITRGAQELLSITAPNQDSLQLQYQLETAGYVDGEKRQLPILPVGTKETEGHFALLTSDTSLQWSFDDQKGAIQLRVEGNTRDLLTRDLQYLKEQPYQCNEQTASRLMAYLIERKWQQEQALPITATDTILHLLGQLQKTQSTSGAWGWWPESPSNDWMTIYVLKALWQAKNEGFEVRAFEVGIRYLLSELPVMVLHEQLLALELLADMAYNINYAKYINPLGTLPLSITDRLRSIYIAQKAGLPWSRDTLERYKKTNILGSTYWGEKNSYWRDNSVQASLMAYKILAQEDDGSLKAIRQYFISSRNAGGTGWRNTFETAQILQTAFKDVVMPNNTNTQLYINGKSYKQFPIVSQLPARSPLDIQLEGEGPAYITAYQQYFNPQPKEKGAVFEISTSLQQNGKSVEQLVTGQIATLTATLKVAQAADYVMIEVPIPAGCSYAEESTSWNPPEAYRQYFRHKAAIFCEHLAPGTYQFELALTPRFEGAYILNPARAELMYFPTFYGHNGINRVEVR